MPASLIPKIQFAAIIGVLLSFALLFYGLFALGAGHGSSAPWYLGIVAITLSSLALVSTILVALSKKPRRNIALIGLIAIIAFALLGFFFFTIADWLAPSCLE